MNQHDETRKMLDLIRESNRKHTNNNRKVLTEQDQNASTEQELDPTEVAKEVS